MGTLSISVFYENEIVVLEIPLCQERLITQSTVGACEEKYLKSMTSLVKYDFVMSLTYKTGTLCQR